VDLGFRARYEQRGRAFKLMGMPVEELSREELFAVIGYLLELDGGQLEASPDHQPLGAPRGVDAVDPPKNDGLYQG